jgi:hypothetical protein
MEYLLLGLLAGALIYRQGIIDGQKLKTGATLSNDPIKPIKQRQSKKKEESEADEFSKALSDMLSYNGEVTHEK